MSRSKEGKQRVKICPDSLDIAVNLALKDGISARAAAIETKVARATIQRHVIAPHQKSGNQDFNYENNSPVQQVFSSEEKIIITKYLLDTSKMHYGLTKRVSKKLAFQFHRQTLRICHFLGKTIEKLVNSGLWIFGNVTHHCLLENHSPQALLELVVSIILWLSISLRCTNKFLKKKV